MNKIIAFGSALLLVACGYSTEVEFGSSNIPDSGSVAAKPTKPSAPHDAGSTSEPESVCGPGSYTEQEDARPWETPCVTIRTYCVVEDSGVVLQKMEINCPPNEFLPWDKSWIPDPPPAWQPASFID